MEIKYLEWNLHAMGGKGYSIPEFIPQYIKSVDVFVLTEFCSTNGWEKFKREIEKDFDIYTSPFVSKDYNQICIGLRRPIKYKLLSIVTVDVCDINIPEYLRIDIEIDGKKLSVIGTRIKSQGKTKEFQYNYLKDALRNVETVICLGDFNCVYNVLSKKFSEIADVYGPRVSKGYHSYVFDNGNMRGLDWVIAKGLNVYNGYSDKVQTPIATYDWDFINSTNGYGNKTKDDHLNINGLPDHAILKGMFRI